MSETKPWIEKYRPKSLKSIILPKHIKKCFKRYLKDDDSQNLLLTGTPGIGKTTSLLALANTLYGSTINNNMIELNASDDRGIRVVQNHVENFCRGLISTSDDCKINKKMVILDEADNMTDKAQQLISNLMDKYQKKVIFGITCNSSTGIIEAIQSRCKIIRFRELGKESIIDRLKFICKIEKVSYTYSSLERIFYYCNGDLRKNINLLQNVSVDGKKITTNKVDNISDVPGPLKFRKLIDVARNKSFLDLFECINYELTNGYTTLDLSYGLLLFLKSIDDDIITEAEKADIYEITGNVIKKIFGGMDSEIQLKYLFKEIKRILNN